MRKEELKHSVHAVLTKLSHLNGKEKIAVSSIQL